MNHYEIPGARWWKIDIHTHSPRSFDFDGMEGQETESATTITEWLLAFMNAQVDAIVIADHNEHRGINDARTELERLRNEQPPGYRELTLFPGVEITTNDGTHLLAIFDTATVDAGEVVSNLLSACEFTGERGRSSSTTTKSFHDVCALIHKKGGLAIPAHADGNAGLFGSDVRSIDQIQRSGVVQAVELVHSNISPDAAKTGWTVLLGSDAHHLDASTCPAGLTAKFPGSHFTWMKMQELTLDGLKLAISDGVGSALRSIDVEEDPNSIKHHYLKSLAIRHGAEQTEADLSPWLNTLIGGRGVGKSTLVEVVRLAMGRFDELPESLVRDLGWFSPKKPGSDEKRFWDADTQVELVYAKSGQTYRISWTGRDPHSSSIEVWTDQGWAIESGSVRARFPALIYSQKQIYETAKNPQSLLAIIDAQPGIRHDEWSDEFQTLTAEYAETLQKISGYHTVIASEDRLRGELADVAVQLGAIVARRDSPEAREMDQLRELELAHLAGEDEAIAFEDRLKTSLGAVEMTLQKAKLSRSTWSPSALRQQSEENAVGLVVDGITALETSRKIFGTSGPSPRQLRMSELQKALGVDQPTANGAGPTFDDLLAQQSRLTTRLADIATAKTAAVKSQSHGKNLLDQIRRHRLDLTSRRSSFLNSLQLDPTSLKVDVYHLADQRRRDVELRTIANKPTGFDAFFSGEAGIKHVLKTDPRNPKYVEEIDAAKSVLNDLRKEGTDSTMMSAHEFTVDNRLLTHLQTLDATAFQISVDLWFPEDLLQVQYKPAAAGNWRSLEQGSPGQKTAALLSLILRMSDDPLILDQPEDDLDNELITHLIVRTLSKSKSRRQVIIATHNANIVVNADSELVTQIGHGLIPEVVAQGSIQDPSMRSAICNIMEGGESAFSARYRRLMER